MNLSAAKYSAEKKRPGFGSLVAAMVLLQILDALCFPVTRYGTQIIEPFTFAFYRFVISSVILLTIVKSRGPYVPIARRDWWRLWR